MKIKECYCPVRVVEHSDYIVKIVEDPAICEKCGHIVHIFKDFDLQTDQEIILTECSNCKSKHMIRRECGFWWFYFSDLDFKRMYKNILDEE